MHFACLTLFVPALTHRIEKLALDEAPFVQVPLDTPACGGTIILTAAPFSDASLATLVCTIIEATPAKLGSWHSVFHIC